MWGNNKKFENLVLLRALRDEVLADNEVGRDYIVMLYNNSLEVLTILIQNQLLTEQIQEVIDKLLPGIQSLLDGEVMTLTKSQLANIEMILSKIEYRSSPTLETAIGRVKKDLAQGDIFKQLHITISPSY